MLQPQRGGNCRRKEEICEKKSSDTGSSFQWNYWPKSLTTRASKLAEELSSYYKLMKSYYHQERDYNLFRQTARMDRLIKRSATSALHLSTGLTALRFPKYLLCIGLFLSSCGIPFLGLKKGLLWGVHVPIVTYCPFSWVSHSDVWALKWYLGIASALIVLPTTAHYISKV